ncbi:alpha-(1,3)-fucosyltransferase fut-5-like [Argopecten irradians]|uniref:alpha-(1,3)-fucosyltransferase fut-5-like n=1 Tax=Argopecten irradians TaxID=31199 RepID=UPI00371E7DCA
MDDVGGKSSDLRYSIEQRPRHAGSAEITVFVFTYFLCFRFTSSFFVLVFGISTILAYFLWIYSRSDEGFIRYTPPAHKPVKIRQKNLVVSSHAKTLIKPKGVSQKKKSAKTAGTPQKIKSATAAGASIRVHYYNRPPWIPKDIFSSCKNKCHLTEGGDSFAGSDVVVFHTPYITEKRPPKKMGQIWVFHSLEPPLVHWIKFDKWKNVFNWTISYRRDADITNTYGIFSTGKHNKDDVKKEFNGLYKKWQNKPKSTVWMVSNCDTNGKRHLYVDKLQKLTKVDVYGKCGTKNQCPRINTKECLKPYKFYLSFESQLCEDYITEKSFKLYASDVTTLPIVRSGSNVSMFLPPGSYIDTTKFKQKRNLVNHMESLSKSKLKFQKYVQWRESYQVNEGTTHSIAFCELCRRLHQKDVHQYQRLYTDIGEWLYWDHSRRNLCKPPNDLN